MNANGYFHVYKNLFLLTVILIIVVGIVKFIRNPKKEIADYQKIRRLNISFWEYIIIVVAVPLSYYYLSLLASVNDEEKRISFVLYYSFFCAIQLLEHFLIFGVMKLKLSSFNSWLHFIVKASYIIPMFAISEIGLFLVVGLVSATNYIFLYFLSLSQKASKLQNC